MTWEPTNELRWLQRAIYVTTGGGINDPSYASPQCAPVLQQKWRLLDAGGEWQEQWRDVPTEVEP
jgi:hypothetical protein